MAFQKDDEKGKKPDFTLRAKQPGSEDFFYDVGACWIIKVKGEDALSITMHTNPLPDPKTGRISIIGLPPKKAE
jgi:hypothetical protein